MKMQLPLPDRLQKLRSHAFLQKLAGVFRCHRRAVFVFDVEQFHTHVQLIFCFGRYERMAAGGC
jgi:hypothetical protein